MGLFAKDSAGTSNEIVFGKQGLFLQGPAVITPPCIIILDGIRGTRTLYPNSRPSQSTLELLFRILTDPRVGSSPRSYRVDILEAKDDAGQSLLPADQRMTSNQYSEGRLATAVQVENLMLPARTGGKLVTLRGTLRFLAQTKSEIWEVPDILKVKNASKTMVTPRGTERYEIIEVVAEDDRYSTIKAKVTREFRQAEVQEAQIEEQPFYSFDHNLSKLMRVLDADGKELPPAGGGVGDDNKELTIDFGVTRIAEEPRGRPATLIWEIPTEYKEVVIPFEFKDLSLP